MTNTLQQHETLEDKFDTLPEQLTVFNDNLDFKMFKRNHHYINNWDFTNAPKKIVIENVHNINLNNNTLENKELSIWNCKHIEILTIQYHIDHIRDCSYSTLMIDNDIDYVSKITNCLIYANHIKSLSDCIYSEFHVYGIGKVEDIHSSKIMELREIGKIENAKFCEIIVSSIGFVKMAKLNNVGYCNINYVVKNGILYVDKHNIIDKHNTVFFITGYYIYNNKLYGGQKSSDIVYKFE